MREPKFVIVMTLSANVSQNQSLQGARLSRRGNPVHSCNGHQQLERDVAMIDGIASSQTTLLTMTRFIFWRGRAMHFASASHVGDGLCTRL